jgi:hypothetical protein
VTGVYLTPPASERNQLRIDAYVSYQPTPGTVFFAGYSSFRKELRGLHSAIRDVQTTDFFLKAGSVFRV